MEMLGVIRFLVDALKGLVAATRSVSAYVHGRDDDRLYREFVGRQRQSPAVLCWELKLGSAEHRAAERLVSKGMICREGRGRYYSLA